MKSFLMAMVLLTGITAKAQCELIVRIENVKKRTGRMMVALCNNPTDFYGKVFQQRVVEVPISGEVIVVFKDLPQGKYAVRLFHDENNSGKLETGMFGIPKEPYGFSNNPAKMGKPEFADAAFPVSANQTIIIRLK